MKKSCLQSTAMPLFRGIFLLLGVLLAAVGNAVPVGELYSARVPVPDHSDQARIAALREGLGQVLVKLSGDSRILQRGDVHDSLAKAASLMSEFGYLNSEDAGAENSLYLEARFLSQPVDQLVRRLGLPVWPASRPQMSVWLVVDTAETGREFVTAENYPETLALLKRLSVVRALPIQLPLLDLQDQMTLPAQALWDFNREAILQANRRYGSEASLAIRLFQNSEGQWLSNWMMVHADTSYLDTGRGQSLADMLETIFNDAADMLSAKFTYIPHVRLNSLEIRVQGVGSYGDFREIERYLKSLELVRGVGVLAIEGDQISFRLDLEGDRAVFLDALARDGRIMPATLLDNVAEPQFIWHP